MNRNIVLFICACLLSFRGQAQINFVLNPQFEIYTDCPVYWDESKYCTGWSSLDTAWNPPDFAHDRGGVADYCHVCANGINSNTSVPINDLFRHQTRSGSGMMQVQMYYNLSDNFMYGRDYLQGHLSKTLISGHTYQATLYTCAEQGSICKTNNIGMHLDDGSIDSTVNPGWTQTLYTPQVIDTNVISDTLNWTKIEGMFTANGTERFITIGNFKDRFQTTAVPLIYGVSVYSWYLIEDVSVIDCDNIPFAGHDTVIHPGDSAFLGTREGLLPYTWYKLADTTAITAVTGTSGIVVKPTATTSYVLKQELCKVVRWDTVKVWVWPDTPSTVNSIILQLANLSMYPNPAGQSLTIEGAKGLSVAVYDLVGRCVVAPVVATEKEVLQIGELVSGVYFVRLTDVRTGEVVTRRVVKE